MKVNIFRSHKRFNTQLIKDLKNVIRVFPSILGVKHKTLYIKRAWAELEILQKNKSARGSIDRV